MNQARTRTRRESAWGTGGNSPSPRFREPRPPQAHVKVEFSEQPGLHGRWDRALLRKLVESIIRREAATGNFAISLHLVGDDTMHELNHSRRGVDAGADVLSFPLQDPTGLRFVLPPDEPVHLGDVVVSYHKAEVQAAEYGHGLQRELAYLVAHGALHILGFDHEREDDRRAMREREEAALAGLGLTRER